MVYLKKKYITYAEDFGMRFQLEISCANHFFNRKYLLPMWYLVCHSSHGMVPPQEIDRTPQNGRSLHPIYFPHSSWHLFDLWRKPEQFCHKWHYVTTNRDSYPIYHWILLFWILQLLPDFCQQLKELVCCVPMPVSWLLNWANCPHLGLLGLLVCGSSWLSSSCGPIVHPRVLWTSACFHLVLSLYFNFTSDCWRLNWSERDPTIPSNWTMDMYNWKETKKLIRKETKSKSLARIRKAEFWSRDEM